jgi:hypothetical protein
MTVGAEAGSSMKLIAMISRKIFLQRKINKWQNIIEDIYECAKDHMNSSNRIEKFQNIYDKSGGVSRAAQMLLCRVICKRLQLQYNLKTRCRNGQIQTPDEMI